MLEFILFHPKCTQQFQTMTNQATNYRPEPNHIEPPTVEATKSEAKRRARQDNFHSHSGRCRKGKNGKLFCALCLPYPTRDVVQFEAEPEAEQWHQCFLPTDPEKEWVDLKELQAEAYDAIEDPPSAKPPPTTGTE